MTSGPTKGKKGRHTRQAILHYGRHIYHLDTFEDLTKLRTPNSANHAPYEYVDVKDLFRSKPALRDIPWDYVDFLYLSNTPSLKKIRCKGKKCKGIKNSRKYMLKKNRLKKRKTFADNEVYEKKNRMPYRTLTRFKIIDNSDKTKPPKEIYVKQWKNPKKSHARQHKKEFKIKKIFTSSSSSEEPKKMIVSSIYSNSKSSEEHESYSKSASSSAENSASEKKSTESLFKKSSEESIYKKKKHTPSPVIESESNSIEKSFQKMKMQRKKKMALKKLKKLKGDEEVYVQGNRYISAADSEDGRRRLPQFLPKRYHWEPDEMQDLGYYWFNGPKGKYPEPRLLKY